MTWACLFVRLLASRWCCWWLVALRPPRDLMRPKYTKVSQGDVANVHVHFDLCYVIPSWYNSLMLHRVMVVVVVVAVVEIFVVAF